MTAVDAELPFEVGAPVGHVPFVHPHDTWQGRRTYNAHCSCGWMQAGHRSALLAHLAISAHWDRVFAAGSASTPTPREEETP